MTYKEFWNKLNMEFNFTIDVCADERNKLCTKYFDRKTDGLKQSWKGETVWCHPQFGESTVHWVRKAGMERDLNNVTSVLLLPCVTTLEIFWKIKAMPDQIRIIRDEIENPPRQDIPKPFMILVFRGKNGRK